MSRRAGLGLALTAWATIALAGCARPEVPLDQTAGPSRIAVMAPAAGEMLDALGALDRVVGVGDFVTEPPRLAELPRIGAYDAPNVERLLELQVDLLITAAGQAGTAHHSQLEQLGVDVLALETGHYEGVFASLDQVGQAIGRTELAREVGQKMRAELAELADLGRTDSPRSVLFVVGRDPLFVAGPGSHVDEMLSIVGGRNVGADLATSYSRMSLEAILERMPEVIVDTSDNRSEARLGRLAGRWEHWPFLPAVRNGRVYHVHPSRLVIPGIRLPEMTRLMGKLVRPEKFGEATEQELGPR